MLTDSKYTQSLRETIGFNLCDKRDSLTAFKAKFPKFDIEEGFTEEDELWTATHRETWEEFAAREQRAFNIIFSSKYKEDTCE